MNCFESAKTMSLFANLFSTMNHERFRWRAMIALMAITITSSVASEVAAPPELVLRAMKAELHGQAATLGMGMVYGWDDVKTSVDSDHPDRPALGRYFAKQKYVPAPLPKFASTRDKLPSPVYEENTNWVAMYWKSWELAFRNFQDRKSTRLNSSH